MKKIWTWEDFKQVPKKVDPSQWTALIPAAGKGSRLGFSRPKILYPLAGKTILEWLTQGLSPFCENFVLVLSPDGKKEVLSDLEAMAPQRSFTHAIQPAPLGMGDAVFHGLDKVQTPYVLVIWGDQVAIKEKTLEHCLYAHSARRNALLTLPTFMRKAPYIHFERRSDQSLSGVLQKREGDQMPAVGESDSGLFLFQTKALKEILSAQLKGTALKGAATQETNFLPLFPFFEKEDDSVLSLQIIDEEETIGVNTPEEAVLLSRVLAKRI